MSAPKLVFKPIDLRVDQEDAIRFREDSYVCSFGDAFQFSAEHYVLWLEAKLQADPWSAVHAWVGEDKVGQMELGFYKPDPKIGYVNLYYLRPEWRGKGVSSQLDEHAMSYLKDRGHQIAMLSVSPSNVRALRYYRKLGWVERGPRPGAPEVILMEKEIP